MTWILFSLKVYIKLLVSFFTFFVFFVKYVKIILPNSSHMLMTCVFSLTVKINENVKNGLKLKHYIINNYRHSNSINAILPLNDSKFIINECYITDLTFDMNEYYTITLKYYYINISPYSNSEIRRKKLKIIFNDDI